MRERDIFIGALEKDSADRAAYLHAACGADTELRSRVERLLLAHEQQHSFILDAPLPRLDPNLALDPLPPPPPSPPLPPGTIIGRYRLLEPIGEGGYGVVFMAEQTSPVQRRVALKLIKAGMDTRQVIARFEAERQALALMEHPNIAKVFDAGTTNTGRSYFVMELVKGVPITRYCDEHRLEPRQRLELFMQVCQAVQHAHQKGIIHRDLKPSNVLVAQYDGKPVAKVIDFGIAKATGKSLTDRTMYTGFGDLVGTLEYMSPEQTEANQVDVDTRSDIYSLGVLLYELLTGSTPLEKSRVSKATVLEMMRLVREEEPPRPSTRLSAAEHLPSIAACRGLEPKTLSDLVHGELDWIVMKAMEKDRTRRYETANGFAADVQRYLQDEAVLACPPSAAYRFRKFTRRNRAAMVIASLGLLAVLLVAGTVGWAMRDRQMREAAVAGRVEQALGESEALYHQRKLPEAAQVARNAVMLADAGAGGSAVERRAREWVKDLDMVARLEEIHPAIMGSDGINLTAKVAEYTGAFREYGIDIESMAPAEAAARIAPRPIHVDLAVSLDRCSDYLWRPRGDARDKNAALYARLREIARLSDPDPLRNQLRELVTKGDSAGVQRIGESLDLGTTPIATLMMVGDAHAWPDPKIEFYRRVRQAHPDDFAVAFILGAMYKSLDSDPKATVRFLTAAVAIRPNSASAHQALAASLWRAGMPWEAIGDYREAIRLGATGSEVWMGLAQALLIQGHEQEAIAAYQSAVPAETDNDNVYLWIANVYARFNRKEDALAAYREGIRTRPDNPRLHVALASELVRQKRPEQALLEYREALKVKPDDAMLHYQVGNELAEQGFMDEAIEVYRQTVRIKPTFGEAHLRLGNELKKKGLKDEATLSYREVIRLEFVTIGVSHPLIRAVLEEENGLLEEAIAACHEAVRTAPDNALAHSELGSMLAKNGSLNEAIAACREAVRLAPDSAVAHSELGLMLERKGLLNEAIASYQEGLRLHPADRGLSDHLGNAYGKTGQWDKAAAITKRMFELNSGSWGAGFSAAELSLYTNDIETYRRICRWFLDSASDAINPPIIVSIVSVCALEPGFGADRERVINLLEYLIRRSEQAPDQGWYESTEGVVDYRAGRFSEAAKIILRAGPSSVTTFSILAMAQQRLGKFDEARKSFAQAQRLMAQMPKVENGETFGDHWFYWMRSQYFFREAEQVMKESTPSTQKSQ